MPTAAKKSAAKKTPIKTAARFRAAAMPIEKMRIMQSAIDPQQAYIELDKGDAQVIVTLQASGDARVVIARPGYREEAEYTIHQRQEVVDQLALERAKRAIDLFHRDAVLSFAQGVWCKKLDPELTGLVPIAARDGSFAGWVEVLHQASSLGIRYRKFMTHKEHPLRVGKTPEDVHMGWWFSKAIPTPMLAPTWGTD